MPFKIRLPRKVKGSNYPEWEDVELTEEEEAIIDEKAREQNIEILKDCIDDVKAIAKDKSLKDYQTDLVHLAIALFDKRASHVVYHKERKAKDKFDKIFKEQNI